MRTPPRLLAICLILVTGCSMKMVPSQGTSASPSPAPASAHVLHGTLHGGQQPLYMASIYMYQIATTGFAAPSISMLHSGTTTVPDGGGNFYVPTAQDGSFQITADDYNCTAGQQVYLYSIGGQPGVNSANNSQATLMALLGDCSQFSTNLHGAVQMNELSTIAAAYALAGYATDGTDIGSGPSSAALTGVANAFYTASNLVDLSTGLARTTTPGLNGTVPQTEINTLGNILAACVNETDNSDPNQNMGSCGALFSVLVAPGCGFLCVANDTATAAIYIAHAPASSVSTLYGVMTASGPFQPSLSGAPNDWTIAITYTGNGLSMTDGVAVDGAGHVWVSNEFNPLLNNGSMSVFDNAGNPLNNLTGNGVYHPYGIAVDASNNAWVADNDTNTGNAAMSVFTQAGGLFTNSPFTGDGLNFPRNVAIDAAGNIWVNNGGADSVSEFGPNGAGLSISGFDVSNHGAAFGPTSVAADNAGNMWVSEQSNALAEFSGGSPTFFAGGNMDNPVAIATDATSNVWLANHDGDSLSEFDKNGNPLSVTNAYTGGGLVAPNALAIDGNDNVWVTTVGTGNGGVSEFDQGGSALSPSTAYANSIGAANGIAIDSSGNLWLSGNVGGGLAEIVGVAGPVITPLSVAAASGKLGTTPQ